MSGVIDDAMERYAPDDHAGMLEGLSGIALDELDDDDAQTWFEYRVILNRSVGRTEQALSDSEDGISKFPDSGRLHFARGRIFEEDRRVEDAFGAFARVRLQSVGGDYMLAVARYAYLWDRADVGRTAALEIVAAYHDLGIIDDNFLHMRGLPFFSSTFGYIATFGRIDGDEEPARSALSDARQLSDANLEGLEERLERFYGGHSERLLHFLSGQTNDHGPDGYRDVALALLGARGAASQDEAQEHLDSVSLTDRDFPWLEDVRTLGRAEACGRFGDSAGKDLWLGRFEQAQPLLFEPDHVFSFDLFDIQEELKQRYRHR